MASVGRPQVLVRIRQSGQVELGGRYKVMVMKYLSVI